jgi:hypothetical protein
LDPKLEVTTRAKLVKLGPGVFLVYDEENDKAIISFQRKNKDPRIIELGQYLELGTTVVEELTYGQASDPGKVLTASPSDHTHGTPPLPTPTEVLGSLGDAGYLLNADPDAALGVAWRASELHGIPKPGGSYEFTVSYNSGTRTWTLTPTGASFYVWIQGKRYKFTGAQTVTHANTNGGHFCYFNSSGVLTTSTTPWDILTTAQVAFVLWHSSDGAVLQLEERHTATRNAAWHANAHHTVGTQVDLTVGLPTISGYTLSLETTAGVSWALTAFKVRDEDIDATTGAVLDGGASSYPVLYLDALSDWRRVTNTFGDGTGVPFATNGTTICYNQAGVGLTACPTAGSGSYVNVYVIGCTEATSSRRVFLRPGNQTFASLTAAQAVAVSSDMTWPSNSPTEYVPVYRLTYWARSSHSATTHRARLEGVQVLIGSRASTVVGSVTSHAALSALSWTLAGHTAVAAGDIPWFSAAATPALLTLGSEDDELTVQGGVPTWSSYRGARWRRMEWEDDFGGNTAEVGEIGDIAPWNFGGTGSRAYQAGEASHPGILRLTSGAVANDAHRMFYSTGSTSLPYIVSDIERFSWILRIPTYTSVAVIAGLGDSTGAASMGTNSVFFWCNTGLSAFWRVSTQTGGVVENTVTAQSVAGNTWYLLEAVRDSVAGTWAFYINDTLVASHTTFPTTGVNIGIQVTTLSANARDLDIDYFAIRSKRFTSRWT